MNDTRLLEPPDITAIRSEKSKWDVEREAFRRLLPALLDEYRGQYAAIHDGRVVASGDNQVAVAMDAYQRYGYKPIYVGLVSDESPKARMPSARRIPPRAG